MTLLELFQIDLPVIQAPMAGVQDSQLAIAVSNAGGLGSLPSALLDSDSLAEQLQLMRAGTSKPFNVNFFCHSPPTPDQQRDAEWLKTLEPYFSEFNIDPGGIAKGLGRPPIDLATNRTQKYIGCIYPFIELLILWVSIFVTSSY